MTGSSVRRLFNINTASIMAAVAFGLSAGLLIPIFSGWSVYRLLFVCFVLLLMPILFLIIGDAPRTMLIALAFAIPLGFSLSPFGNVPYHAGGAPPIVVFFLSDFPLAGLVALWLVEAIALRKPIRRSGVFLAAILWIGWSALSAYNSTNQRLSFFEVLRMAKLFVLMLVVSNMVRGKRDIEAVLYTLLLGVIAQCVISAVQYTTGSNLGLGLFTVGGLNRVSGTIGWPNTLGAYAAAITSIGFLLFINRPSEKLRRWGLVAGLAGFLTFILSFSRGAWIAFAVATVAGVVISYVRTWISFKDVIRLGWICLLLPVGLLPLAGSISARLAETNLQQGAIADRFLMNEIAYNMIAAHPLLGVGVNTFVEVERRYDTTGISFSLGYPVHNFYLLVASETGLIGLGTFLIFVGTILYGLLPALKSSDPFISSSAICLVCGLAAILISNLADDHLRTDVLFTLFWFIAGLGIALSSIARSSQKGRALLS